MSNFVVRRARAEDRAACTAIYTRALPQAMPNIDRVIDEAAFDNDTDGEDIFVMERGDALVGFAAHYAPGNFLHHLYVAPEAQRSGVGSALLTAIRAHAPAGVTLKVQLSNRNARAFYEAQGWAVCGEGEDAYGPWLLYGAPD